MRDETDLVGLGDRHNDNNVKGLRQPDQDFGSLTTEATNKLPTSLHRPTNIQH